MIQNPEVRRLITSLYAETEAELIRFARSDAEALNDLANAHTPPGVIAQVGPRFSFDESKVTAEEMRNAVNALAAEESLGVAINAELRRREMERAFLDAHVERLERARGNIIRASEQVSPN